MYGDFPANYTVCTSYIRIYVWFWPTLHMHKVGQDRMYTPYLTVYWVISLPIYHIHTVYMVLANPTHITYLLITLLRKAHRHDNPGFGVTKSRVRVMPPLSWNVDLLLCL